MAKQRAAHIAHMYRYEGMFDPDPTPRLVLIASSEGNTPYTTPLVPGLRPVQQYKRPQSHVEYEERQQEMSTPEELSSQELDQQTTEGETQTVDEYQFIQAHAFAVAYAIAAEARSNDNYGGSDLHAGIPFGD